jgi:hypothetical protein
LRATSEGTQDIKKTRGKKRGDDVSGEKDTNVKIDEGEQSSDITRSLNFPDPKAKDIYVNNLIYNRTFRLYSN